MPTGIPLKISESFLRQLYITDDLSIREISRKLGTNFRSIQLRLQRLQIRKKADTVKGTRIRNAKRTMKVKYGSECYMKSRIGYNQYRQKLLQNFGVTNIMQLKSTKQNRAKTCQLKYGVDHDLKAKSVREKMRQTLFAKYGVDNAFKSKTLMASALANRKIVNGYLGRGKHIETKFGKIFIRSSYEEKFLIILLSCLRN